MTPATRPDPNAGLRRFLDDLARPKPSDVARTPENAPTAPLDAARGIPEPSTES